MGKLSAAPILVLSALIIASCESKPPPPPAPAESIRLGLPLDPTNWLMVIAVQQGILAEQGLEVEVREYVSGKRALNGLLAGEVDVATTAEVPMVFRLFERDDFACLGTVGSSGNEPRIVARNDAGIECGDELRGKRVATQRGSAVHFFLHLFLVTHGLTEADVKLSFMKGEELAPALAAGEIDAFSMREPFVSEAEHLLGDKAIVFAEPGLYQKSFNLVATSAFIAARPEALRRLVAGVLAAETFARDSPELARGAVSSRTGIPSERVAELWREIDLDFTLRQELLLAMEDEARWAMENRLVPGAQVPNFLDHIHAAPLGDARPDAVTIVGARANPQG